jgi:hypothetical protein
MQAELAALMPSLAAHEGVWRGTYRHLDAEGRVTDVHSSEVRCEFPDTGDYVYVQHNRFIWDDGRERRVVLPGVLREGRLWWDVEAFCGWSWESRGVILLDLERKDDPGASFLEMITLSPSGRSRARTWHWFKDGALFRRTLCDEVKV